MSEKVALSAGYGLSHLYQAAAGLTQFNELSQFFSTAYPTRHLDAIARLVADRSHSARRFRERSVGIAPNSIETVWSAELLWQVGIKLETHGVTRGAGVAKRARRAYARAVARRLRPDTDVYHFRAGFGGTSLGTARRFGIPTICDHSIAHPDFLQHITAPTNLGGAHDDHWGQVRDDIRNADYVLANSHFVASTCIEAGVNPDRVKTIYTVTDASFLRHLEAEPVRRAPSDELRILFAGALEYRKGIDVLATALDKLDAKTVITIAGTWMPDSYHLRREVERHANVVLLPHQTREALAALMLQNDMFILPSRAEGSARVLVEAASAGMYIVTTPEAGFNPKSPKAGRTLVRSGDPDALAVAINDLAAQPERLALGGVANRRWAASEMTVDKYVQELRSLYAYVSLTQGE